MSFAIWEKDHLCPLAILMATSGSIGNKLLFKYPSTNQTSLYDLYDQGIGKYDCNFSETEPDKPIQPLDAFINPISSDECNINLTNDPENTIDTFDRLKPMSYIVKNKLSAELKDDTLVGLLVGKSNVDTERFFLKLEDVLFIGHCSHHTNFTLCNANPTRTIKYFNVVFALKSTATKEVQTSYYILAKSIANAICFEEKRKQFLTDERYIIQNISDCETELDPSKLFEEKSQLYRDLKQIVDDVSRTGIANSYINKFSKIHYCISQRIYNVTDNIYVRSSHVIHQSNKLRPYHTLIFLKCPKQIYQQLVDPNPQVLKLMQNILVTKSITTTCQEQNLKLPFSMKIARALVQWGMCIIVYPISNTNRYWIAPYCNTIVSAHLLDQFQMQFPTMYLPRLLSQINEFHTYREIINICAINDQLGVELFTWLLKHRLIYQVHRYYVATRRDVPTLVDNIPREIPPLSKSFHHSISNYSQVQFSDIDTQTRFKEILACYAPPLASTTLIWEQQQEFHSVIDPVVSTGLIGDLIGGIDSPPSGYMDADALLLLNKLLPLCDGSNHLEEIEYQMTLAQFPISRPIDELLNQMGRILLRFDTADPVTSCFVGLI